MTEDEMVGWHHRLNGHEFEQARVDGEGQGSLAFCSPWDRRESDMTERLHFPFSLSCIGQRASQTWIESSASPLILLSLFPFASCVCVTQHAKPHLVGH